MGIINEEGKVCRSKNEETAKEREALMQQVKDFLLKHSDYSIQAVGISTPGIVRKMCIRDRQEISQGRKNDMMQKIQRFGGAMFTPVLLLSLIHI